MKRIGRGILSSFSLIGEKADDIIFTTRICQGTESGENEKKIDLHEYDIARIRRYFADLSPDLMGYHQMER